LGALLATHAANEMHFEHLIAALAAIAAIRPAKLNEFFPPERNAAISPVAGSNVNFCLIEEFHICNVS